MFGFSFRFAGTSVNAKFGSGLFYGADPVLVDADFDLVSISGENHILLSVDTSTQTIQCYQNDVVCAPSAVIWNAFDPIKWPTIATGTSSHLGDILDNGQYCMADVWWGVPSLFVDLNIAANRRKFITAGLLPVFLGSNGQLPFGSPPQMYNSVPAGGVVSDFTLNRGSLGGTFSGTGLEILCTLFPPSPPPPPPPPRPKLNMDNVVVTSLATESPCTALQFSPAPAITPSLGLRWSDTRGEDWGNPVPQEITSDPLSQPQWNRTGYARDRVFELFWSSAFKTALNGAFVEVEPWKS